MPNPTRPLSEIAQEISLHWANVSPAAAPYLDAMADLDKITDPYYADSGKSIVLYFLANAQSWRGEIARRVKAELNQMVKNA